MESVKLITKSRFLRVGSGNGDKTRLTHFDSGTFYPLGAAFYSNATYPETLKVIDTSGVPSVPFSLAGTGREQFNFNFSTGEIHPVPPFPVQFLQAVAAEIPRYASIWQQVFAPISVPGYKASRIEEIRMPHGKLIFKI